MGTEPAIEAHIAEYQALRTEADQYSQRIDRIVGVYLTALFAIAGFTLRPDADFDFSEYIASVQSSNSQMALLVFATILNSALIVRIVSFFLGVLAITQYTNSFLRHRISELVGQDAIRWDGGPAFSAKVALDPA
ncbi:hypothetical protein [Rhodophyticola porphyridii]|uniref:hypothetical protein n=1 Tax=Rhodophyticola porphyridii TaxID=1852017 RepID=UPI0035CF5CA6